MNNGIVYLIQPAELVGMSNSDTLDLDIYVLWNVQIHSI